MAQKLINGYSWNSISPRCALKVNLQKAFDTIDLGFMLKVLKILQFPIQFIKWIRNFLTKSRFSVAINGGLAWFFKGGSGIRQGDPLSPYLFVMVMNVLSRLLNLKRQFGVFKWHPRCRRVNLTHLCFVDDMLIFVNGDLDSVLGVKRILHVFYLLSDLKLNVGKIEIFAGGVGTEVVA